MTATEDQTPTLDKTSVNTYLVRSLKHVGVMVHDVHKVQKVK